MHIFYALQNTLEAHSIQSVGDMHRRATFMIHRNGSKIWDCEIKIHNSLKTQHHHNIMCCYKNKRKIIGKFMLFPTFCRSQNKIHITVSVILISIHNLLVTFWLPVFHP